MLQSIAKTLRSHYGGQIKSDKSYVKAVAVIKDIVKLADKVYQKSVTSIAAKEVIIERGYLT